MQATMTLPPKPQRGEAQRSLLWVILITVAALVLAIALRNAVESRSTAFTAASGAVSLRYPSAWVLGTASDGTLLAVSDPHSPSSFRSLITVRTRALGQGQQLIDAATAWTLSQSRALREFQDLGSEPAVLAGKPAIKLSYAYVAPAPPGAGLSLLPVVVRATDTLVTAGNQVIIVGVASDAAHYKSYADLLQRTLASVTIPAR